MIKPQGIHYVEPANPYVSLCGLSNKWFERVSDFRHVKCLSCEKGFYARYGRAYSSMVEQSPHKGKVSGSNPGRPI